MNRGVHAGLATFGLLIAVMAGACTATSTATPGAVSAPTSSQTSPSGLASDQPTAAPSYGGHITWSLVSAKSTPQPDGPSDLDPNIDMDPNATLEGWHGGYVEFMWHPTSLTVTPWTSADAVHWSEGHTIDAATLWGSEMQAEKAAEQEYVGPCTFRVTGWADAGAALLMRGRLECAMGCGSYWQSTELLFASQDGAIWTPRDEKKLFGAAGLGTVSGGSSGFAALGVAGRGQVVWTSKDGLNWNQHAVPAGLAGKGSRIGDPASINGGLVLPGAQMTSGDASSAVPLDYTPGPSVVSCAEGSGSNTKYVPAIYWSPDGSSWTSESLPGAVAGSNVYVNVARIDDRAVVATEDYQDANGGTLCWLSADGRSWRPVPTPSWDFSSVLEGLDRAFLIDQGQGFSVATLTDTLQVVNLAPEGDTPSTNDYYQVAAGPAGLLVTVDGTTLRIGVVH